MVTFDQMTSNRAAKLPKTCEISSIVIYLVLFSSLKNVFIFTSRHALFCYYASWDQYKLGDQKFLPHNIDPYLCSHIVYAFATLDDKFAITDPEGNHKILYQDLVLLKKRNNDLKILLAVGGWNFNQTYFSLLVGAKVAAGIKTQFISHSITYMRENGFDGINLDWEYPGDVARGGDAFHDKYNFVQFLKEMREMYNKEAKMEKQSKLLLTVSAGVSEDLLRTGYNAEFLTKYADYVLLLSYNYNGCWDMDHRVGYISPLRKNLNTHDSVEATIYRWTKNGASSRKLVIGIPTYGTRYQLSHPCVEPNFCGSGLTFSTCGDPAQLTLTEVNVMYHNDHQVALFNQICKKFNNSNNETWNHGYDKAAEIGYAHSNGTNPQWISFETKKSVFAKVQMVWTENLGGAFVWLLSGDDHTGQYCTERKGRGHPVLTMPFPITRTIGTALKINRLANVI